MDKDSGTGCLSEEKIVKTTQAYYTALKAANARSDWDLSPGALMYMAAADFLSKYYKFMERDVENKNRTDVEDGRRTDGDGRSEEMINRGRTWIGNRRSTGGAAPGPQSIKLRESKRTTSTKRRLYFDETEESPQSATGATNDMKERSEDIIDLV